MVEEKKPISDRLGSKQEIVKNLEHVELLGAELVTYLTIVTQDIKYIFVLIQECNVCQEAQEHLDTLQKIHLSLAAVLFKYELGFSENLQQFVRDFERLDDHEFRCYVFNKIKSKPYKFGTSIYE